MGKRLYFIWKGDDCRAHGVQLATPIPIIRPEERVTHVEIPGRSGDLTQLQGEDIYNPYIQTATIEVPGAYNVRKIANWLKGSGFVTFHGEPDRKQPARVIGAITLNKHSKNSDWWVGECQFYCQPLKQLLTENVQTITASGSHVLNSGDVKAKPLWTVTASGTTVVLASGGKTITVTGLAANDVIQIDSEIMEVLNSDRSETLTANSSGGFPILAEGDNTVTGSGWSTITVTKRERFL